jgi:thiosulfate reductase cytochrome b subunit
MKGSVYKRACDSAWNGIEVVVLSVIVCASAMAVDAKDASGRSQADSGLRPESRVREARRHSAVVRITHWLTTLAFGGLLVSGIAILLAHPRLYWGETGAVGGPSLLDLPLPFLLTGQSGWGRSLHFLSAWVCILTGLVYAVAGVVTTHFRTHLLPAKAELTWDAVARAIREDLARTREDDSLSYNVVQRLTYLGVVFAGFPLMIWTGFAMSPAITSVFPWLVNALDGQQSARTIHFVVANLLVVFLLVHVVMVSRAGLVTRVAAMITGRLGGERGHV